MRGASPRIRAGHSHETSVQHRPHLESAHLADHRRADQAGQHRLRSHGPASVRTVLAAVAVRGIRRRRNVDVLADDGEIQGRRAVRRHPGVYDAAVLPHHHARAPRREDRFPCRSQGQARRRPGISADRGAVGARRDAARVRCRAQGDGILDGAAAVAQPWRRDRIRAAAGGDRAPDTAGEKHRRDDAVRRARRRDVLSGRSQSDRSQHRRSPQSSRHQAAVSPTRGRRACAIIRRPASTPSTMAW